MILNNTDQGLLQRLSRSGKGLIYGSIVPYKNNTCIKVYDEEGNPLGDIPEEFIVTYINQKTVILFINESIDDNTGLPFYTLGTMV